MTPQTLRSTLITQLGTLIGTYTTANGKTYPAIRVTPPITDPSWKVSGLEVLIYVNPESVKIQPVTGQAKLKRQWWNVILTQFDITKSTQPALDIIERGCKSQIISRVTPQSISDFERCAVSIFDPVFINNL